MQRGVPSVRSGLQTLPAARAARASFPFYPFAAYLQILSLFEGVIKDLISSKAGPAVCKAVAQAAQTTVPPLLKKLDLSVSQYLEPPTADPEPSLPGDAALTPRCSFHSPLRLPHCYADVVEAFELIYAATHRARCRHHQLDFGGRALAAACASCAARPERAAPHGDAQHRLDFRRSSLGLPVRVGSAANQGRVTRSSEHARMLALHCEHARMHAPCERCILLRPWRGA